MVRRHLPSADLQWTEVEITLQVLTKSFMTLGGLVGSRPWPAWVHCLLPATFAPGRESQLGSSDSQLPANRGFSLVETSKTPPHWLTLPWSTSCEKSTSQDAKVATLTRAASRA